VPYTTLTTMAWASEQDKEEFTVNIFRGITVEKLDCWSETSISMVSWHAASCVAVDLVRKQCPDGNICAQTLLKHHEIVTALADHHGWIDSSMQNHAPVTTI